MYIVVLLMVLLLDVVEASNSLNDVVLASLRVFGNSKSTLR